MRTAGIQHPLGPLDDTAVGDADQGVQGCTVLWGVGGNTLESSFLEDHPYPVAEAGLMGKP